MENNVENAEFLIEKLLNFYKVSNVAELSTKINTSQKTISNWKIRNSINAIKKRCRELGIYDEIFLLDNYTYPPGYFDLESPPSIYDEAQKELEKQITKKREIEEILKMDETIVISFVQVYKKLEEENNLIKLYEALGKLKYGS